ncbi:MAG: hypothetical protein ACYTHK_20165 [Planctomycetota bacterium]|jgi:hypothetical protein
MRGAGALIALGLLLATPAPAENPVREIPLLNVELLDSKGVKRKLTGFHMLNGDFRFQGYRGSAEIEVSYHKIRGITVSPPETPGGRMRADLLLRTGRTVKTAFDEREGEILFAAFHEFDRVTFFFRDIRELKFLGRTRREDLPAFGKGTGAVDARIRDREGLSTEVTGFRRAPGEATLALVHGATSVTVPLRALRSFEMQHDLKLDKLVGVAVLRSGTKMKFVIPTYEEERLYRADAEFGPLRIRLRDLREVVVHRSTPKLRPLDPLEAARGKAVEEDRPVR